MFVLACEARKPAAETAAAPPAAEPAPAPPVQPIRPLVADTAAPFEQLPARLHSVAGRPVVRLDGQAYRVETAVQVDLSRPLPTGTTEPEADLADSLSRVLGYGYDAVYTIRLLDGGGKTRFATTLRKPDFAPAIGREAVAGYATSAPALLAFLPGFHALVFEVGFVMDGTDNISTALLLLDATTGRVRQVLPYGQWDDGDCANTLTTNGRALLTGSDLVRTDGRRVSLLRPGQQVAGTRWLNDQTLLVAYVGAYDRQGNRRPLRGPNAHLLNLDGRELGAFRLAGLEAEVGFTLRDQYLQQTRTYYLLDDEHRTLRLFPHEQPLRYRTLRLAQLPRFAPPQSASPCIRRAACHRFSTSIPAAALSATSRRRRCLRTDFPRRRCILRPVCPFRRRYMVKNSWLAGLLLVACGVGCGPSRHPVAAADDAAAATGPVAAADTALPFAQLPAEPVARTVQLAGQLCRVETDARVDARRPLMLRDSLAGQLAARELTQLKASGAGFDAVYTLRLRGADGREQFRTELRKADFTAAVGEELVTESLPAAPTFVGYLPRLHALAFTVWFQAYDTDWAAAALLLLDATTGQVRYLGLSQRAEDQPAANVLTPDGRTLLTRYAVLTAGRPPVELTVPNLQVAGTRLLNARAALVAYAPALDEQNQPLPLPRANALLLDLVDGRVLTRLHLGATATGYQHGRGLSYQYLHQTRTHYFFSPDDETLVLVPRERPTALRRLRLAALPKFRLPQRPAEVRFRLPAGLGSSLILYADTVSGDLRSQAAAPPQP
ncbi:hypothetical protein DLM85_05550 [Hymenobacter edaphi]|uniref:Uncharacterized protein n=1 Tax=Hymenobacter edaphi TaxID=2211146 RepID=A0A328BUK6_9BACT|nr:hypothetical protein DLM85_05550 [Hymenobacter edaphi]